ncbi:type I restriction enzyme HsdR N-terminal domain-containing protein [Caloranaerobacter sp. DY30410]|uniref:type I restriction enzyme HsdR N-terminal domain-containing protein n=1 Tax=Caloranaerobacter sp. DY30410 TaxID=3238305 RepID=UPI003D06EC40
MYKRINLEKYKIPIDYKRLNNSCVFDPIRKKLIIATPEEIVRQKIIKFLINEMDVPEDMIGVEIPMKYFKNRARGRADIIVYGRDDKNYFVPVMIVECKAPDVPLTDKVLSQVMKYDEIILADTIMVTNGNELVIQSYNYDKKDYFYLKEFPNYRDLINKKNLVYDCEKVELKRPKFSEITDPEIIDAYLELGLIGEDTPKELYKFIINLNGLFINTNEKLNVKIIKDNKIKILKDGGLRYTTFGNAAGGNWSGLYRYFIIEDDKKNNQIISIGVFGTMKCENDPVFGNRKGTTSLTVAVDAYNMSHISLHLNIDKYCTKTSEKDYTIWHDGRLTIGNIGSAKNKEVIEYVKNKYPELVIDDKIYLGSLDNSKEINFEQENTIDFLVRLIKYALIRDEFRRYMKKRKG